MILTRWIFANRAGLDFAFYLSVKLTLDTFLELREGQLAIDDFDILRCGERLFSSLAVELRELGSASEEIVVGGFKATQGKLKRLRIGFFQPHKLLLQFGEFLGLVVVVQRLLLGICFLVFQIVCDAFSKEAVVNETMATEVLGEKNRLLLIGVNPEFVSIIYGCQLAPYITYFFITKSTVV